MLQIRLGAQRAVDPTTDPLGRTHVGYRSGMSVHEAWLAGRGVWKLSPSRALEQEEVQIISPAGVILAVADVLSVHRYDDRFAVDGNLKDSDPRIGAMTDKLVTSQNPVSYI